MDPIDDDWRTIQTNIEGEYQQKLKEVNDEAMRKLRLYQTEHKKKLERSHVEYQQRRRDASRSAS